MISTFIPVDVKLSPPPQGLDPAAHYIVSRGALPHDRDIMPGMSVSAENRPGGKFFGLSPVYVVGHAPIIECEIVEVDRNHVIFRVRKP